MKKTLIVITGATASGKTSVALGVAEALGCDIISADSRQIYAGIPICTAVPTTDELRRVHHHFVSTLPLDAYYSAALFEADVLRLLPSLWERGDVAVMCGGSMMYVDAVTDGIDQLPTISESVRRRVKEMLEHNGLQAVLAMLELLDPQYYAEVDRANTKRVCHALEISLQAGVPYSSLRSGARAKRDFRILKFAIDRERADLFGRINARVEAMDAAGLEQEARSVYHLRHLNSLNTVGFKEMFAYFDGTMTRQEALLRIAKNTRVYAKKQLTWLSRPGIRPAVFLPPDTAVRDILRSI